MIRRNIVPNPLPISTNGWTHLEASATLIDFSSDGSSLHYKGIATGSGATAGVAWNDYTKITVKAGQNYGFTIDSLVVTTVPVGFLRMLVVWHNISGTIIATSFGQPISVGTYTSSDAVCRILATAPTGAVGASVALEYQGSDTSTPVEWQASGWLMEPLGAPQVLLPGALVNQISAPSLEYGSLGWNVHTSLGTVNNTPGPYRIADGDPVTYDIESGWSKYGTKSMRITGVATNAPISGLGDFIGTYIDPAVGVLPATPGVTYTAQTWNNVLSGPSPGSPGLFEELFFYYFDGDPTHTILYLHANGPSLYQPITLGEQLVYVTATCPPGANTLQMTTVMRTSFLGDTMDFYVDAAMLTVGDDPVDYFDGDQAGCGWGGFPGASASASPGVSARIPGSYFDGDALRCQWEGKPHLSMSSTKVGPLLKAYHQSPAAQAIDLMAGSRS